MAGGRPTKLTKALVARARTYDFAQDRDVLPTVEGLALYLKIARSTLYEWAVVPTAEDEPDAELRLLRKHFSDIVSDLLARQSKLLINNGLKGRFNANITRLILSGKHGYVEKQATDLTTNGKDLPVPILGGGSVRPDDSDSKAA